MVFSSIGLFAYGIANQLIVPFGRHVTEQEYHDDFLVAATYGGYGMADPKGPLFEAPLLRRVTGMRYGPALLKTLPAAFIFGAVAGYIYDPLELRDGPNLDLPPWSLDESYIGEPLDYDF